jgi:hypothetical protein
MFTFLTIFSLVLLTAVLSYRSFKRENKEAGTFPWKKRRREWGHFFWSRTKAVFSPEGRQRLKMAWMAWIEKDTQGWVRWIFIGLSVCALYLVLSGFLSALFSARGLFGPFLLLHVVAGGIFAVCLGAAVFLRAGGHPPDSILSREKGFGFSFKRKAEGPTWQVTVLFWLTAASGFVLISTALSSMVPYFDLRVQIQLLALHRYTALIGLLSTIAYFHFSQNGQ